MRAGVRQFQAMILVVEVYVDVDDDAGDQDGVLDLGEALGEVLLVSENNVHEY